MKWRLNKCMDKYIIDVFSDDYSSYITLYDKEGETPLIFNTEEEADLFMKNKKYEDLIHI